MFATVNLCFFGMVIDDFRQRRNRRNVGPRWPDPVEQELKAADSTDPAGCHRAPMIHSGRIFDGRWPASAPDPPFRVLDATLAGRNRARTAPPAAGPARRSARAGPRSQRASCGERSRTPGTLSKAAGPHKAALPDQPELGGATGA
ncbi:hypothetical protein [Amycolatopsis echigonensis]|uniref:hypothetical protein n=1 Tax=Amycolatopsis echigonensis TaxID=2576905 RepID=UPI0011786450|nr:hypothetical protein [Amycolatopsis niigatensis]